MGYLQTVPVDKSIRTLPDFSIYFILIYNLIVRFMSDFDNFLIDTSKIESS
jgi:hypothetical protein